MIEINIGALVVLMGIPTAATGFCFWMLEHRIQKRAKQKEATRPSTTLPKSNTRRRTS